MDVSIFDVWFFSPFKRARVAFFVSESACLYNSTSFFSVALTWIRLALVVFFAVVAGFLAAGFFAAGFFAAGFLAVVFDVAFAAVFAVGRKISSYPHIFR